MHDYRHPEGFLNALGYALFSPGWWSFGATAGRREPRSPLGMIGSLRRQKTDVCLKEGWQGDSLRPAGSKEGWVETSGGSKN